MRFALPQSALMCASLDDSVMQRSYGITFVEVDKRKRWVFEGPSEAFIEIVDHCIHMDADHGAEDASMGSHYTRTAGRWAQAQAAKLLAAGQAKRDGFGGVKAVTAIVEK